jgi:hypothetical protein
MEFFKPYTIVYNYTEWKTFLSFYLVSVACDNAAVILGRRSGVAKL